MTQETPPTVTAATAAAPAPADPSPSADTPATAWTRRRFLAASSALGLAVVAAACGGEDDDTGATGDDAGGSGATTPSGDAQVAAFAAGLEVLAVNTYKAAGDAAAAGKLGAVPPAVAEFVKTAMGHHQEHLDAWNKVLGADKVTTPDARLKPVVDAEFAKVKGAAGAAKLALMLEEIAAQTYLKAIPSLRSKDAIRLAGSIQAVDQQHQAILLYALGQYPVPETFQKTDKAASPA